MARDQDETAAPVLPGEEPGPFMPPEVIAELTGAYRAASVILEYGSGGSTKLAAQLPGKTVFSVESDAAWLADLQDWLDAEPRPATMRLHHADIGPTGKWGMPLDEASFRKWPGYAQSVWDRPDFEHPDMVLVDGRFRLACMVTVLARITRPTVMLVDDYAMRPVYHRFETLQPPARLVGRMARFELLPQALPGAALPWIMDAHLRPK